MVTIDTETNTLSPSVLDGVSDYDQVRATEDLLIRSEGHPGKLVFYDKDSGDNVYTIESPSSDESVWFSGFTENGDVVFFSRAVSNVYGIYDSDNNNVKYVKRYNFPGNRVLGFDNGRLQGGSGRASIASEGVSNNSYFPDIINDGTFYETKYKFQFSYLETRLIDQHVVSLSGRKRHITWGDKPYNYENKGIEVTLKYGLFNDDADWYWYKDKEGYVDNDLIFEKYYERHLQTQIGESTGDDYKITEYSVFPNDVWAKIYPSMEGTYGYGLVFNGGDRLAIITILHKDKSRLGELKVLFDAISNSFTPLTDEAVSELLKNNENKYN